MNSMKPSLVEEDEDGDGVPDYLGFHENEEFNKATTKKTVACGFQAISMAISDMIKRGHKKLNGHKLIDAESLFRALDEDFSGTVDRQELRNGLKKCKIGANIAQLEAWIDALDINGDGKYSKRRRACIAYMESTVVDISIPPPSFKPISLFLSRSPLLSNTQTSLF